MRLNLRRGIVLIPPPAARNPQHATNIACGPGVEHSAREYKSRLMRGGESKGSVRSLEARVLEFHEGIVGGQ